MASVEWVPTAPNGIGGFFLYEDLYSLAPGDTVILNNGWPVIVINPMATTDDGLEGFEAITPAGLNPWSNAAVITYSSIAEVHNWNPSRIHLAKQRKEE